METCRHGWSYEVHSGHKTLFSATLICTNFSDLAIDFSWSHICHYSICLIVNQDGSDSPICNIWTDSNFCKTIRVEISDMALMCALDVFYHKGLWTFCLKMLFRPENHPVALLLPSPSVSVVKIILERAGYFSQSGGPSQWDYSTIWWKTLGWVANTPSPSFRRNILMKLQN